MRVKIDPGDNDWFLTFIPEPGDDLVNLQVFVRFLQRYDYKIDVRDLEYMQSNVDLIVSKVTSGTVDGY